MTQTILCPNCGHCIRPSTSPQEASKSKAPPGFERWWKSYREALQSLYNRSAKDKARCIVIWKGLGAEIHADWMVAKLEAQVDYRREMNRKQKFASPFPDPIRYLRHRVFEEELPE